MAAAAVFCNNLFPVSLAKQSLTNTSSTLKASRYDSAMAEPRMKIIVVDDDARLRDLLNRYLSEQGYAVRAVRDAAEMNRHLARERYDLMILDLMLPGEDGLSICRRLRSRLAKLSTRMRPLSWRCWTPVRLRL